MTYKINDVALATQPTRGGWLLREPMGTTGDGRSILSGYRSFEMRWDTLDAVGMEQLISNWELMETTGTCSVDLPRLGVDPYGFHTYSGVYLEEPQMDRFFEGHYINVILKVSRITVL